MGLLCLAEGHLVAEARALGIQADVLPLPPEFSALGESGLLGSRLSKAATLAKKLTLGSPATLRYIKQFRQTVGSANADIIHSNGVKSHLLTRFLPRKSGKIVWHIHDLLGGRALLSSVLHHAAGRVSGAIAISQAVAKDLKTGLPRTPFFTALNAIDTDHFTPSPHAQDLQLLDRLAGLPPAPPGILRIGLVATYARWKGQDIFLEAIAKLPASSPARFYIIGSSIYHTAGSQFSRQELQQRALYLGIAERLGFIDFQPDPLAIYRALDVVVHASSKPEPFGLTIVQAMACGRAVIVSNSGGAAELFSEGIDALGIRPANPDDLASAMSKLIADAPLRIALGTTARQTATHGFNRSRIGPQMLTIYQQLLSSP